MSAHSKKEDQRDSSPVRSGSSSLSDLDEKVSDMELSSSEDEYAWVRELSPTSFEKLATALERSKKKKRSTSSVHKEEKVTIKKEDIIRFALANSIEKPISADQSIVAYKAVSIGMTGVAHGANALLRLRIPLATASIYNVEISSGLVKPADLSDNRKYCTNLAYVDALQVSAPTPSEMKKILFALQTGNATLDSKHNRIFKYHLQQFVSEPNAGKDCGNGACGSGIYFYTKRELAFGYLNASDSYVISNVVDRALLLEHRSEKEEAAEEEMLEEAHQRRVQDLQQWAEKRLGTKEDFELCV